MSESVGSISLDLVIQEKLSKQLESIKAKLTGGLSKPMEQVEKAVEQTFENTGKSVDKFTEQTKQDFSKLAAEAVKPMQEMQKKTQQAMQQAVQMPEAKPVEQKVTFKTVTAKDMLDAQGLEDPVAKVKEKVDQLNQSIKEAVSGFEVADDPTERLRQELDNTNEKIALTQKKWQELSAQLDSLSNKDIALGKGDKIQSQMNRLEKSLISLRTSAEATEAKLSQSLGSGAQKGAVKFSAAFSGVKANISQIASSLKSKLGTAVSSVASGVKKVLGGAFNSLKTVGGKALNTIKDKISGLRRSVNSTSKPLQRLGNSIKSAAKSALLMAGLYAAFRALKTAITDACNGNDEFAKSLNEIKANLQIAFTPIMQTIMPYINSLMSAIASATKTIAAFISELLGSTYKKSLEAAKAAQKTAQQIEKTQKNYLASFDVMNVAQDTSESSNSADTSERSIDYSAINGDDVQLPDWAARMKDAIKAGDWGGVGSLLAEKVNGALNIDWTSVGQKVNGVVGGIADALNGFANTLDWDAVGDSIAGGLNTVFGGAYTFMSTFDWSGLGKKVTQALNKALKKTDFKLIGKTLASRLSAAIDFLYEFVTGFDWSQFGKSIGDSVNAWFDEIDWAKLGETVSGGIKGVLDTIINFIQTVDWQGIGEKLWTFLKNIDWGGIVSRLFELIGSAITGAVSLLWGFIHDAVFSIGDYFAENIQECGGNIAGDFTAFLQTVFQTLGTTITGLFDSFNMVFSDIWNLAVFPILQNFLSVGLPLVIQFATQMWSTFGVLFENVKEIFDTLWTGVVSPILNLIKELWIDVWEVISESWEKWGVLIFDGIREAITNIKDLFMNVWQTVLQPVFDKLMSTLTKIWKEHLKPLISSFLDFVGTLVDGALQIYNKFISPIINWFVDKLGPVISRVFNDVVDVVGGAIGGIIDAVKGIIDALKGVIEFITGVFTGDWEKAWNGIKKFFKGIWDAFYNIIKTPLNFIIDAINKMLGAIESAINWVVDGINKISFDVPDWVPIIGGKKFGFSLNHVDMPEIPRLAEGGLAYAPQLAMVGDNKNASVDPEVIAPLSKLKQFVDDGSDSQIVALLREIIDILVNMQFVFHGDINEGVLYRAIVRLNKEYKSRTGVSAL